MSLEGDRKSATKNQRSFQMGPGFSRSCQFTDYTAPAANKL